MKKYYPALIALGLMLVPLSAFGRQDREGLPTLIIFHSPSCHECLKIRSEVMPYIEKDFSGVIQIEYRDINDVSNYQLLSGLKEKYKAKASVRLPVFFIEGNFLEAQGKSREALEAFIGKSLQNRAGWAWSFPAVDLIRQFKAFKPLVIIGAGLIDGINPCAFTVIVFFISFLALQGYKRRDLIVIGLCFISAVFLTYLLIGLGLFGFLFSLKSFWGVIKIFNLSVGIFSVAMGVFAVYDLMQFKKTNQTEGMLLQLPTAVKNRIHAVIGLHYRKTSRSKGEEPAGQRHITPPLVTSAFITGFLVSILEAVCTGQTYLPTIAFVLKTTRLKAQAMFYLLLYNFMFIAPLFAIFFLALLGTTSQQFSNILKRHMLGIKMLMAALFFSLGIFLIWRA